MLFLFYFFPSPFQRLRARQDLCLKTHQFCVSTAWACAGPVSRFSPPVVSIQSYILVFRLGLALYLCEPSALHLLPPISFSTVHYFSVTVRNPDGIHLFRSFLSLSQYWTWQMNEDLHSRKFAEVQRKSYGARWCFAWLQWLEEEEGSLSSSPFRWWCIGQDLPHESMCSWRHIMEWGQVKWSRR